MQIKVGDLLDGSYPYIAHQCYAVAGRGGGGLAHAIFTKHPEANAYTGVEHELGTIEVKGNVINMFCQRYAGKPSREDDTAEMRLKWFKSCLFAIGELRNSDMGKDVGTVAFPYLIGCGLGGGYWLEYEDVLIRFDNWTNQSIILVKLND